MAKESLNFYEAERKNIVITQDHITRDYDYDFAGEMDSLHKWFEAECNIKWENNLVYSKTRKRNEVDTRLVNEIFNATLEKFSNKVDSVQIFDAITSYYDFDAMDYYNRLAHKNRTILIKDLSIRIGDFSIHKDIKIDETKIQKSFAKLFNR